MKHITKDGKEIDLKDLETSHLKNIIAMIERKAKNGIIIRYGGGGCDIDSMWYEEDFIKDEEALSYMNHSTYVAELNKRLK